MQRKKIHLASPLWDERLTTTEAHRHLHAPETRFRPKKAIDQVAGVLILQGFMEAMANRATHQIGQQETPVIIPKTNYQGRSPAVALRRIVAKLSLPGDVREFQVSFA
jgi:Holliday junction resolvase